MSIPPEHEWLFWDVDPAAIDLIRDRRYVLGRVLERGRMSDVRWVVGAYGLEGVREFFRSGGNPELSRATRILWQGVLGESEDQWPSASRRPSSSSAPWID
jgi:hypothetical protein